MKNKLPKKVRKLLENIIESDINDMPIPLEDIRLIKKVLEKDKKARKKEKECIKPIYYWKQGVVTISRLRFESR